MAWAATRAVVRQGHRVASGTGSDRRFPEGTIRTQLPFFEAAIPDFAAWIGAPVYAGTINLAVDAGSIDIVAPEYRLGEIAWTSLFPPENFFLSRCLIEALGKHHPAYLYIPDPATKPDHRQATNIIEILSAFIPGLAYGEPVTLHYQPEAIALRAT